MSLREQKKRQTREDIVTAASRLISERGFEATRMRDIAAAAQLSYQTLYNYFPTKGLIVQALLQADMAQTVSNVKHVIATYEDDLLGALATINHLRFNVVRNHERGLWREIVIETYKQQTSSQELYAEIESSNHLLMISLLRKAQALGQLDPELDIQLMTQTLFAQSEFAFGQFVVNDQVEIDTVLDSINAMTDLLVQPYLRTAATGNLSDRT